MGEGANFESRTGRHLALLWPDCYHIVKINYITAYYYSRITQIIQMV